MAIELDRADEVARLAAEFSGVFGPETIERYVAESIDELAGARVVDFLPVLVHRFSRERLIALAQSEDRIAKEVPEVLFVCVHNAGRSQMAAGLLDQLAEGRVHVRTAGSDPAEEINPAVIEAMAEVGVDLSQRVPEAADRRGRRGCRRRDHDGLRGRLPDLSGQALRGLGVSRTPRARASRKFAPSVMISRPRCSGSWAS